ncbi:MAG: flavodoxin domain-containing protein [Treponema sp.]|nr:flavodoxin domain-containing protein [Treponema sp.]
MSKTLVIYYSKYGTTKLYAQWIAAELQADLLPLQRVSQRKLSSYGTIVLGSAIYGGTIKGTETLFKNQKEAAKKHLVLFTCGIADVSDPSSMEEVNTMVKEKIPPSLVSQVPIYNFQGGINYKKLSFVHKLMMDQLYRSVKEKNEDDLTERDKKFLETYGKTSNHTDSEYIEDLVKYLQSLD